MLSLFLSLLSLSLSLLLPLCSINSQGTLIKSFVYQTPTDMWRNALGVAYGGNGGEQALRVG